jgi:hypothetical protein
MNGKRRDNNVLVELQNRISRPGRLWVGKPLVVCETQLVGPVAQRLEQQTHNLLVVGSNPTGPTSKVSHFLMCVKHRPQ